MSLKTIFLLAVACLVGVSHALANDEPRTVPQIVISATRSPAYITQVAGSITVIDREEIERKNKPSVTELLRETSGLSVAANGGTGQTARVFMRGTNSNHVLVMMDGVALNDPSDPNDAFDFSNLSSSNIERIEILRGAQSTLYGSQAIGGVINIISKQGRGAPRYNGFAEYGSFNSKRAGVGTSGEVGRTSYNLQASGLDANGISSMARRFGGHEKDGSTIHTFSGNAQAKLTDNFTGKLNLRYNRNETQFDSPGSFTRPYDDPATENDSRQFNGRAAGEWSLYGGAWTQELGLSYLKLNRYQVTEFFDTLFNSYFGAQQYASWREKLDWIHRVRLAHHALTFGVEVSSDHYKFHSPLPELSLGEINVDNKAVFFDDQIVYGDFFVNASFRADLHQGFGRKTTWKIAPGYYFSSTGTRIKTSYGTGFKAPSLYSLYDLTYGNPALNPETSKSYDFGFEQTLLGDKLLFGATLFRNDIRDLLNTVEVAPLVYRYTNIGAARTQGVEATLEVRPSVDWKISGNYTFTQADDRSADTRLKRRPKHTGSVTVDWQYDPNLNLGASARYSGVSFDYDFAFSPAKTKAFATMDMYGNYRMNEVATLYAKAENLLDKRYEEVYGYGQPGLAAYGGVKVSY